MLHFCLRSRIEHEASLLIKNQVESVKSRAIYCAIVFSILFVGIIIEYSILNAIINKNDDNPQEWTDNIIAAGCEHSLKNPY